MTAKRLHEEPFTPAEVERVLRECGTDALLVGGQALAFWAAHYAVARPLELAAQITADVDFVGRGSIASRLGKALGWNVFLPTLDDATSQTGKVTKQVPGGGVKQIDFLSGVVGLDTTAIEKRAAETTLGGSDSKIRVMHPLDVLASRIKNVEVLPEKRDRIGLAQAKLAVNVAGAFLRELAAKGDGRSLLNAVERVIDLALDPGALKVHARFGIDPLAAITPDDITTPEFHEERWPRVLSEVDRHRRALARDYAGGQPVKRSPRDSGDR